MRFSAGRTTLFISAVDFNDEGSYHCLVSNSLGKDERTSRLRVHVPPRVSFLNTSTKVLPGSEITLYCGVNGIPEPRVTWWINGRLAMGNGHQRILTDGAILTIKKMRSSDEGVYECVAMNAAGSDHRNITIYIQDPQTNSQTDRHLTTIPHHPATISPTDKDHTTSSYPDVLTSFTFHSGSGGPGTDQQSLGIFAPSPLVSSTTVPMDQEMGTTTLDPKHQTAFTSHSGPIELDRRDNPQLWWTVSAPSLKTRRLISVTSATEEPIGSRPSAPPVLEAKVWGSPSPGVSVDKEFPFLVSARVKNITSPPTSTMKPLLPAAMTTVGTFPTPEKPLTVDSQSMATPLSGESSTPVDPSPNMTRLQLLSKRGTQCSNISCLLKLPALPPKQATKQVLTQERVKLFASNTTAKSLTHLNHSGSSISIISLLPEATIWNSNFTPSQTLQKSDGSRGNVLSKVTAKGKKPSPSFVLEKHDIPIVVGVTLSLAMIFITMGVYSLRQKTTENGETERRLNRGPRSSNQQCRRFEMRTYDNRAFENEKPSDGADQGQEERQKLPPGAVPRHPSPNTITVTAEFALDSQSHGVFSISGEGRETSQKELTSTSQQDSEPVESSKSQSLPSPAEDKTGNTEARSLCSLLGGNAPASALPEIKPSLKEQEAEASLRLNSAPCLGEEPLRGDARPLLEESLWKGNEKRGASRFDPRSDVRECDAFAQSQLSPARGIVSRSLSECGGKGSEVMSVAVDVPASSPIPAAVSLPALVPNPTLVLLPSASNQ
uniref:Ig-like domain-containing protein n=1 Tax=Callorhinchus milii TaxID=7868 RepID=A0A4W3JMS8_CALMI